MNLLFLHYYGGAGRSWGWTLPLLREHRCLAPDLPGFGGTAPLPHPSVPAMAEAVIGFLREKEWRECALIGHSMGGKIAAEVAVKLAREGLIRQLILLAPSPPSFEAMPEAERQRMLRHNREEAEATVDKVTVKPLDAERRRTAVETQLETGEKTWRWWPLEGMSESIAEATRKLALPIAVVASDDDPSIGPDMIRGEVMPNLPPHARLLRASGIGHLYPLEDPEWLAEMLRQLLQ